MKPEKANCIVCKREFDRRVKGMKDRAYKIPLRPYRSLTCSQRCAVLYSRMPLNKRDLLKVQGGIINMEEYIPDVILNEDLQLTSFDDERGFGFVLLSEEKHNPNAEKGSDEEYYHDQIRECVFKERENYEKLKKGMKLISDAIFSEMELEEEN